MRPRSFLSWRTRWSTGLMSSRTTASWTLAVEVCVSEPLSKFCQRALPQTLGLAPLTREIMWPRKKGACRLR